jgi:predicted metal-dependent hydrolase
VRLEGQELVYRLLRVRRRSIGMVIDHDGLTVRAPRWVGIAEIESALVEKGRWIVRKLADWRERSQHAPRQQWQHGAPFLYRGQHLELAVYPARVRSVAADLFHLRVTLPNATEPSLLAGTVGRWLREQTETQLVPLVHRFAGRISARVRDVRLSTARTQWGSCNRAGEIRLNYRLIQLPPHLADYVVAHEVAHLRELNHSPRFWSVVETLYPEWQAARRQLHLFVPLLDG